jgi:hypothetical protein
VRCAIPKTFRVLDRGSLDGRRNGGVIQAESDVDVDWCAAMGWWDLKVKCVLATGMTVLDVSLTV